MNRRSKFLLFLPTFCVLLLAGFMAWLLRTENGADVLWHQLSTLSGGQIKAQSISGSLASTLVLNGFEFSNDNVRLDSPKVSLSVDFDVLPPAVRLTQLRSESLLVQLLPGASDDTETSLADTLTSLKLPMPLQLDAVQLQELQILDIDGTELFSANDIQLRAHWHRGFELQQLSLHSLDTDWTASAALELDAPFESQGKITGASLLTLADDRSLPLNWQAEFDGDLATLNSRLQVSQPDVFIKGQLLDLLTQPAWNLQLQAAQLDWPLIADESQPDTSQPDTSQPDPVQPDPSQPQVSLRDLQLSSQGNISAYELQLAAQVSGEQIPPGTAELIGSGNDQGMQFEHLRFAGDEVALFGTGQLDWQQGFDLSANSQLEFLHPARWLAEWPQEHPVAGNLQLRLTGDSLEFTGFDLNVTGHPLQTRGNASYRFTDGEIGAVVNWQSLSWPITLDAAAGTWSSPEGQLNLAGQIDDWNAQGELQLLVDDFAPSRMQLSATGDRDRMQLVIDQGQVLGGQFAGTADYQWTSPASWSAQVTAKQLNTSSLLPDFPGVVSGTVSAQGEIESSNLQFDLRDVQGQLRGLDFRTSGKFSLQDSIIEAKDLLLQSGSARVELDGGMGPGQSLSFTASVEKLADLWPNASGRLQASGKVSLDAKTPVLDIALNADELSWGENHIASIRTSNGEDGSRIIRINQATLAGREFRDVQLSLAGRQALESLQLEGQMNQTEFSAALRGQLVANSQQRISGWQGLLENLRLSQPERGFLDLESPAELKWSMQESSLGQACLRGNRDGRICLQGQWSDQGQSSLQSEVHQVSLDIVQLFVDMDWSFTHRLDGRFAWEKSSAQAASATAQFTLSPGELLFEKESTNIQTGAGQFEFQISEGNLHSGKLLVPITGSGEIRADFNVAQLLNGGAADLQASLQLNLRDLTPLQLLLPYADVINGEINADIRISGSPEKPKFTGHATLVRGHFENQASGLVLSDIKLAGAVFQYDYIELNGSFRAGEGQGRIKADVRFEDFLNPQLSMQLSGEGLLLADGPDLNLLANPDLKIGWTPGQLQLNGRILVPSAQLSPRYLPSSSASESPDLVIVSDQEEVQIQTKTQPAKSLRITGEVELELGDRVNFTLDKATASIRGKTRFIWNNGLLPTGDGNFMVSGEIYAYGQLLTISEGRVSFPRSPADNPHLNIKAEREIFGNSQIKRAGVRLGGTLKRPTLEPYTDPMTTRERALAMLLTGSDFDYEQGVGAVEVGMYIAPKLFISYGIGLFDDQNVISARYDLGKGFGVKATSGQRETGVDISYTIER